MLYVLDSSFVAAQIIPDEKEPMVEKMYAKIKQNDEKHAPHLIWYEITNIFKNLLRRNRYTYDNILLFFPFLGAMRLTCDYAAGIEYSKKILTLCDEYSLSSYDAAYLELAERKKAVLCTMDNNLKQAAKKHGVITLR